MSALTFESCPENPSASEVTRQELAQEKAQAVSFTGKSETGLHTINGHGNSDPKVDNAKVMEKPALYACSDLKGWLNKDGFEYKGLLLRRSFGGKWNKFSAVVDEALNRLSNRYELAVNVEVVDDQEQLSSKLIAAIDGILSKAQLPELLSEQIRLDASQIGCTIASLCPSSKHLTVKLEIFGKNSCSRWHIDHYVGRAIVSYTGEVGTEYTRDTNVDFWELKHCGNNDCVIKNKELVKNVEVGDILFMKGAKFSPGAAGLVHKSPAKRYHKDGRIVNRLVLKVDVPPLGGMDHINNVLS